MSVSYGSHDTRSQKWVLAWTRWYTRGIAQPMAAERRAELESDLFEHRAWAETVGHSPLRISLDILSRTVRGFVADLSWRRCVLAADPYRGSGDGRIISATLQAVVLLLAAGIVLAGAYTLMRVAPAEVSTSGAVTPDTLLLGALTALAAMGLVLTTHRRTRCLGALWMIFPTVALLQSVTYGLSTVSVTFSYLYPAQSGIDSVARLALSAGLVAIFSAAALLWAPALPASRRNTL